MKCPYRKITYHFPQTYMHTARDEEVFAECYGTECPYYVESRHYRGDIEVPPYCDRKETEIFLATHPNYMKGGADGKSSI